MTQENPTPPPASIPYEGLPVGTPTKDETNMATIMYLLALVTNFIGPVIVWLMKKDQSKYIDAQGKELLNFQITMFFVMIACWLSIFVLIGILLLPCSIIFYLVMIIIATINVNKGNPYRFPFAIRLLK